MKKLFVSLVCLLSLVACSGGVRTSTPANDARKINAKFKAAKTPQQRDEVRMLLGKYQEEYSKEAYKGKREYEDIKELYKLVDFSY